MPATDKTWYNIKRLHAIFGVSGLILLFSTLWMFKADHQREWKQYQRKARSIDLRMADWRKLQQQTEVISNARQQIEKKLAEAREAPMDAARLKEFGDLAGEALAEPSEKKLAAVIAASKQEESQLLGSLKFRRADLDKAKADLGLAVRDGLGQERQEELQKDIDLVQVDVDQKTAAYEQAKDKRQKLQSVFSGLMKDVRDLEKQRDDSMAEEQRLIASIQDRQSKWFEGSWLGKRWLELPILDAFNSPLTIENLWSEDLEQDYSHRMVRRFDRCTTCHQSMEKTVPGSATEGVYLRERVVQLRLATPEQVRLQAIEDGTAQPPAEGGDDEGEGQDSAEAVSSTTELLNQYGIQLADAGLLNRGEVTVQFVEPRALGAKAEPLLDIPVAEGHPVEDIVKSILESPGLSGVDLFSQTHVDTRLGFQLGDVLLAINDDPIESRGSAIRTRQSVVLRLLDLAKKKSPIEITVRRGLPHPFSSHPRLDLFVGALSPHKMAQFACTVCHEGQGSATAFKWASHTPDSLGDRSDWMREHGWFDNHHWVYPMHPKRFMESSCLKCHHNVTELQPSEKFPEPPAPKLLKGYNLIRKYGCYGCHEVNGFEGPNKRVGPDMRLEPNFFAAALAIKADTGFEKLSAEEQGLIEHLIDHPEEDAVRTRVSDLLTRDENREADATAGAETAPAVFEGGFRRKMASLLKDVNPPGALRKPGPSLRFVGKKVDGNFLFDWIEKPERFRPSTRMPQFFGEELWGHLDEGHGEGAKYKPNRHGRFEPVEVQAIVEYLQDRSQSFNYLQAPAGITATTPESQVARGKALFQERGCLACHSHNEFQEMEPYRDPQQSVQGPDLSGLAGKFGADLESNGARWLYSWIKQPSRYHARTVMPDLYLDPIVKKDADGKVLEVTDPAADIVAYLLSGKTSWQPKVPKLDTKNMDELLDVYLRDGYAVSMEDIKTRGFSPAQAARLQGHEQELAVSQEDYDQEKPLSQQQKMRYLGRKTIAKYGCYGCHDIPGFEDAKSIGTGLADWGRKDPGKLAFEHINEYLAGHGHGHGHGTGHGEGHGKDHEEAGHSHDSDGEEAGEHAGEAAVVAARGSDFDDGMPDFYTHQLHSHNRTGFLYQKLREPRSYDYHKTGNKTYNERLRMPRFPFSTEDREAVATFVLGLVAAAPREKYVYKPSPRQQAVEQGLRVIDKYNCKGCHVLTAETWDLAFPEGAFPKPSQAQATEQLFPFQQPAFSRAEIEASRELDGQGRQHATVSGLPRLRERGWPAVDDHESNDNLNSFFGDGEVFPTTSLTLFMNLWQPTLLGGHSYETGLSAVPVRSEYVQARRAASGGDLSKYLLPHIVSRYQKPPEKPGDEATKVTMWGYLAPPLIGEGKKVQTSWLHEFLLDPYPIRPSVVLRMPRFNMSEREATQLVNYFAARDDVDFPYSFVQRRRTAHLAAEDEAYRKLLRDQGHAEAPQPGRRFADAMSVIVDKDNCVSCHIVGDYVPKRPDPAPNLAQVYRRLRPDYVRNWVAKPTAVLPYTNMPIVFKSNPDDKEFGGGVKQSLYHGRRIEQLDAVVDLLMNYDLYVKQRANIRSMVKTVPGAPEVGEEETGDPGDSGDGN